MRMGSAIVFGSDRVVLCSLVFFFPTSDRSGLQPTKISPFRVFALRWPPKIPPLRCSEAPLRRRGPMKLRRPEEAQKANGEQRKKQKTPRARSRGQTKHKKGLVAKNGVDPPGNPSISVFAAPQIVLPFFLSFFGPLPHKHDVRFGFAGAIFKKCS